MIHWTGEKNDYTAKVGAYNLKVRKWNDAFAFVVSHSTFRFNFTDGLAATLEQAKAEAEKAYLEHINK